METRTFRIDGHDVHEHHLDVPLDPTRPGGELITVFAREYVRNPARPRLLFLQGGPGNRSPRPPTVSGWLDRALEDYRVVLLDQRGTGLSTPADRQTLAGLEPADQAAYLAHFRADSIVADAEALRRELCGDQPWTLLGQSFGGFVVTAYLSRAPEGVAAALVTGGLPGLRASADEVYRHTYATTARRNAEYFTRYPDDETTAHAVAAHLAAEDERLPTGERLSARRFRQLGQALGTQTGFDALHHLLEEPFTTVRGTRRLREQALLDMAPALSFASHPLYAVLHEAIYAQGPVTGATAWAAHRVRAQLPEFALDAGPGAPFRFTGEHVFPWQFEEDPALVPLRATAELVAAREDFPVLYDVDALAANRAPVAAAIYTDDMFVPYELSVATARTIGNLRAVITNDYQHDGLRADGRALLDRLLVALHR